VTLAALAATATLAATVQRGDPGVPRSEAVATGALTMSNSRDGGAIFSASNFAPGDSISGTVAITNTGTAQGSLALQSTPAAISGAHGQVLLDALTLRISDVTAGANNPIYEGRLAALPALSLSTLDAGDARTFRFSASLPDGGASPDEAADNRLQRSSMTVAYGWTLTQAAEPPNPEPPSAAPPVAQPPAATPPSGRPPAPAATGKPAVVAPPAESRRRPCVRRLNGTARADRLTGTNRGDVIYGRGGPDRLRGRGGSDCIWGGTGNDRIYGGSGADKLHGATGNDVLIASAGRDRLWGGYGADRIYARDGQRDWINCGPGRDRAVVDRGDRVRGCERVLRPARRR